MLVIQENLRQHHPYKSSSQDHVSLYFLFCHHRFDRFKGKQTCSQVTFTAVHRFVIKMGIKRLNFDSIILFLY